MRDDPFFKDTPRKALVMEGESIEFPILYYDFRMISGTFAAKTKKLIGILPHPNFKPIEIFPGTGMIIIVAFEYNDTSIGSYNEIGLAVPVKFPPPIYFSRTFRNIYDAEKLFFSLYPSSAGYH